MGEMHTKTISTKDLQEEQLKRMFSLMVQYYEKVSIEVFRADIFDKQKVILLLSSDGQIQGFSTIVELSLEAHGKKFIAIYSGDTVLEKKYWGNGALPSAFGQCLWAVKMRNPLTPVYWFLISKGYKTYLLMTNNFPTHFPRFETKTPSKYAQVMDTFYQNRFGSSYDSTTGIIRFAANKVSFLKEDVAEIDSGTQQSPRIRFFESKNPGWRQGDELACVAKVTFWIPIRYAFKKTAKFFLKAIRK